MTDNKIMYEGEECYGLTYPILEKRACTTSTGGKISSIILFNVNSMRYDTIGHEAYHAAHFSTINYPHIARHISSDPEEAKATYTGFLCAQLYPCFTAFK